MILNLINEEEIKDLFNHKSNMLIKNAPFDYYYATNSDDIIIDCSDSFLALTNLPKEDLYNSLGIQTLIATLNISTINGEKINETRAIRFDYEYKSAQSNNTPRFFEIGLTIDGEESTLSVIVEPIYLKNKFVGRNVYLSKNNKETLKKLEDSLLEAKQMLANDRTKDYCMMSMIKNVIMFYDYNCGKYLLTEAFCKSYGITRRELTVQEFFSIIHPQDRLYYQEMNEVITSIEVSRLKYRIKVGSEYINVCDDSMYLNKDSNLISIISLDLGEFQEEEIKEETIKEVDYRKELEDTLKVLEKLVDE